MMAPLCPYHLAFTLNNLPTDFITVSGDIDTLTLTAVSLDRQDATLRDVDVIATVLE